MKDGVEATVVLVSLRSRHELPFEESWVSESRVSGIIHGLGLGWGWMQRKIGAFRLDV